MRSAGFGYLVFPEMLGRASHQQQAAVSKVYRHALLRVGFVPEVEAPSCAEADGSDDRIGSQLRFIVTVPGDTITLIAVLVEKDAIEGDSGEGFSALAYLLQRGGPCLGVECNAGVSIRFTSVAVPGCEPGLVDETSEHFDCFVLPGNSFRKRCEEASRFLSLEKLWTEKHLAIAHIQSIFIIFDF